MVIARQDLEPGLCGTPEADGKGETKQDLLTGPFASSLLPPSFLLHTVAGRK